MKKVVSEIHLYSNKYEMLIKVMIWIISWIGGIVVLLGTKNNDVLASAYFIYSLSLLMEFVPKIEGKTRFWSRFLHTIFCFMMAIICVLSVTILLGATLPQICYSIMFKLTIGIIVYMSLDAFVLWISTDDAKKNIDFIQNNSTEQQKIIFEENLYQGNLGNINIRRK